MSRKQVPTQRRRQGGPHGVTASRADLGVGGIALPKKILTEIFKCKRKALIKLVTGSV